MSKKQIKKARQKLETCQYCLKELAIIYVTKMAQVDEIEIEEDGTVRTVHEGDPEVTRSYYACSHCQKALTTVQAEALWRLEENGGDHHGQAIFGYPSGV